MAHRKKKIGAQLVEDEEYQLRYERVAGIDVAKGKADVCTRLPKPCPRLVTDSHGQSPRPLSPGPACPWRPRRPPGPG